MRKLVFDHLGESAFIRVTWQRSSNDEWTWIYQLRPGIKCNFLEPLTRGTQSVLLEKHGNVIMVLQYIAQTRYTHMRGIRQRQAIISHLYHRLRIKVKASTVTCTTEVWAPLILHPVTPVSMSARVLVCFSSPSRSSDGVMMMSEGKPSHVYRPVYVWSILHDLETMYRLWTTLRNVTITTNTSSFHEEI